MEVQSLYQTNQQHLQSNYLSENFRYYGLIVVGILNELTKLQLSPWFVGSVNGNQKFK